MAISLPSCWRSRQIEGLVVLGILAGLFAVLYPVVNQVRNPRGPHSRIIPDSAPEEAHRVVHAYGHSIIAPINWDRIRDFGPEDPSHSLCIAARGIPGGRLKSWITIRRESGSPAKLALQGTTRVQFQGFPAHEKMKIHRKSTFDDSAWATYSLYVDVRGEWWWITWDVAEERLQLPPEIRQYIDTIRFPMQVKPSTRE